MGVTFEMSCVVFMFLAFTTTVDCLRCYTGQHAAASTNLGTRIPPGAAAGTDVKRVECGENEDACYTLKYDIFMNIFVAQVNISVTQGLCSSSVVGCVGMCNNLNTMLSGQSFANCKCCDTSACNNELKKYDSAGVTLNPSFSLMFFISLALLCYFYI